MKLSRVVLAKEGKEAILQGMIHVESKKLYEYLQKDIEWAEDNQYVFFYETVQGSYPEVFANKNQEQIKAFFVFISEFLPILANSFGMVLQKNAVVYPEDAINADITMSELIKELDTNGFTCRFIVKLLSLIPKDTLKEALDKEFGEDISLNEFIDKSQKKSWASWFADFLLRKADPVILDYRNKVAVKSIIEYGNNQNIFVHYGDGHIKGLTSLLEKEGWVVKEISYLELSKFE